MKGTLWLFLLWINAFSVQFLHAQKLAGAEIYYQLLSGKTYLITAQVYRQCEQTALNHLDGFVMADSFKIPMSFKRVSIQKINDTCGNPCHKTNAMSNPGFERHIYTDTIDFTKAPYKAIHTAGLCLVKFAIHQKLRDTTVTTHSYGNGMLYIDAQVNTCLNFPKLRSPEFSFDPKFLNACNQNFMYSPGPIDSTDFDSLSFELDIPLLDQNSPVTYTGNFSKDFPMTPYCLPNAGNISCRPLPNALPPRGFFFDKETCEIGLTPTTCNETGTIKFRMSEWRRDSTNTFRRIGYVCREMSTRIQQMPANNLAQIIGSGTKYSMCNGSTICLNKKALDQTVDDTVYLDWNHGIPDANFKLKDSSAREKEAQFCWTPKTMPANGTFFFGTKSYDQLCNSALTSRSFLITHYAPVKFKTSYNINGCNQLSFEIHTTDTGSPLTSNSSLFDINGQLLFSSSQQKDSFTINSNGTFYLRYAVSNHWRGLCPLIRYDTIQIHDALPKGFEYKGIDTLVCKSYPATLSFSPYKIPRILSWAWYRNDTFVSSSDSSIKALINDTSFYRLLITDTRACHSESKRRFIPYLHDAKLFVDSTLFSCPAAVYTIVPNLSGLQQPITYQWVGPAMDTSGKDVYTFAPQANDKVFLRVKDDNHCNVSDSVSISYYPQYSFELATDQPLVCQDSVAIIKVTKFNMALAVKTNWNINGFDSLMPFTLQYADVFKSKTQIKLTIEDKNHCTFSDSLEIIPLPHFDVTLNNPTPVCAGTVIILRPSIKPYLLNKTFQWTVNNQKLNTTDSFLLYNSATSASVKVKVAEAGQCFADDTAFLHIYLLPDLLIQSDTDFNRLNKIHMSTNKAFVSYQWSNGQTSRDNDFWAYELGPPGIYDIWLQVKDSNGCYARDSIRIHTNMRSDIHTPEHAPYLIYPNPFTGELTIEIPDDVSMELFSADGQLLESIALHSGRQVLNYTHLAPGIYLLKLGAYTKILVKE